MFKRNLDSDPILANLQWMATIRNVFTKFEPSLSPRALAFNSPEVEQHSQKFKYFCQKEKQKRAERVVVKSWHNIGTPIGWVLGLWRKHVNGFWVQITESFERSEGWKTPFEYREPDRQLRHRFRMGLRSASDVCYWTLNPIWSRVSNNQFKRSFSLFLTS